MSQKVTMTRLAAPARVVLSELSAKTGIHFAPFSKTAEDTLLLKVKDVKLSELMTQIADADGAQWFLEDGIYKLTRTIQLEKKQRQEAIEERAKRIKISIAAMMNQTGPSMTKMDSQQLVDLYVDGFKPPSYSQPKGLAEKSPAARAIISMLAGMDPTDLAGLPSGVRTVFSTESTQSQRQLPRSLKSVDQRFVADQKAYVAAFQARDPKAGEGVRQYGQIAGPYMGTGSPDGPLGRDLLILKRDGNAIAAEISVFDPNGLLIANGAYRLEVKRAPVPPEVASGDPIAYSPLALELSKTLFDQYYARMNTSGWSSVGRSDENGEFIEFRTVTDLKGMPNASDALRQYLLSPETHDPQSLGTSEALFATADFKGANLVACVPDGSFWSMNVSANSGKNTPGNILTAWAPNAGLNIEIHDGWMLVKPKSYDNLQTSRVNRPGLGNVVRLLNRQGYVGLADFGAYLANQPKDPEYTDMDGYLMTMINSAAAFQLTDFNSGVRFDAIRFWGTLNDTQRTALYRGGTLNLANLGPRSREVIFHDVFESWSGPDVKHPEGLTLSNVNQQKSYLGLERTEALPNGLPTNVAVSLEWSSLPGVLALDPKTDRTLVWSANLVANKKLQELRRPGESNGLEGYVEYQPAEVRSLKLNFTFSPTVKSTLAATDSSVDSRAKPGTLEQLPENVLQAIEARFQKLKKVFWGG